MNKREAAALLWRVLTHTLRMCFRVCGFSLEKENECMRGLFMGRAQKFKGKSVAPTTEKVSKGIEKKHELDNPTMCWVSINVDYGEPVLCEN